MWAALGNEPLVVQLTNGHWVTTTFSHGADNIAASDMVTTGLKNTWVLAYDFTTKHPFAEHFNGSRWTQSPLPALVDCDCISHAVSASAPDRSQAATTKTLNRGPRSWTSDGCSHEDGSAPSTRAWIDSRAARGMLSCSPAQAARRSEADPGGSRASSAPTCRRNAKICCRVSSSRVVALPGRSCRI